MSEYLLSDLPRYVKTAPRGNFANSVVKEGAVLLFSEDGETLVAKHPDGTFSEIGSGSSGGTSAEYYKCTSVDTSAKTWSGYKAVLGENGYSFEDAVTTGLEIKGLTPVVDSIYSADTMVKIGQLKEDLGGFFELTINVSSNRMIYKFQPYWNTGGYCEVVDWGDGTSEAAVTSGTVLSHTYSEVGTYTIKIQADCYQCLFGKAGDGYQNATMIRDCNFNWQALGNITDGTSMFQSCDQAVFTLTALPENLINGRDMFYSCKKMTADLNTLASNAPAGGYTSLTTIRAMFAYGGNGNSPGTVTGSQATFLAVCPNLTDTVAAFDNTNTTA